MERTREEVSLKNGYCPLCGYLLANDWDGHLLPCIVRHARAIETRRRATKPAGI